MNNNSAFSLNFHFISWNIYIFLDLHYCHRKIIGDNVYHFSFLFVPYFLQGHILKAYLFAWYNINFWSAIFAVVSKHWFFLEILKYLWKLLLTKFLKKFNYEKLPRQCCWKPPFFFIVCLLRISYKYIFF